MVVTPGKDGEVLPVCRMPEHLLQLNSKVGLGRGSVGGGWEWGGGSACPAQHLHIPPPQGPEHIYCSCVSPCGSWVAYCTASRFHLYRVQHEGDGVSVKKVGTGRREGQGGSPRGGTG